jgi:hypothetical protein
MGLKMMALLKRAGKVLQNFMAADPAQKYVRIFGKTVIFQKLTSGILKDSGGQPYVVSKARCRKTGCG